MAGDARKFIITSDYPMDFIVWNGEGQLTDIPGSGTSTYAMAHNLPYAPLPFGILSADDGETWEPFGPEHSGFWSWVESDEDNVTVYLSTRNDPVTIKFKLWGYAPSDTSAYTDSWVGDVDENSFFIDSDFDYSKLVYAGKWDVEEGDKTVIYNHNLGYIPQVATWEEYDTGVVWDGGWQTSTDASKEFTKYIQVDENNLYAQVSDVNASSMGELVRLHYRIYGNEMEG